MKTPLTSGEIIKMLRDSVNMNRAEFSRLTGIPIRTLENWENDVRKPPEYITRLLMYAVYVNKSLDIDTSKTDMAFIDMYIKNHDITETKSYNLIDSKIGNIEIEVVQRKKNPNQ